MKLLLSNQHGAIVMALLPFLYGMLSTEVIWQHAFLLMAWLCLYLMSYPFLSLFKGHQHNQILYIKWSLIYGIASLFFALPALMYNWHILYFLVALIPLILIHIHYVRQKNERALFNDIVAIILFSIGGMAAYYFPHQLMDIQFWQVGIFPSLFFIAGTLYVKSVLRERKNPLYLKASLITHSVLIVFFLLIAKPLLALAFLPPLIRAWIVPKKRLSVKQVGLLEIGVSVWFLIMLLINS